MASNGILEHAQMLIDEEQYEKAYEILTGAYNEMKENAEYLEKTALLAKTLEKNNDAVKYWEDLVSVNPNSLVAYSELLDIYENKDKYKYFVTRAKYKILNEKVTQAVDDYKKAINSTQEEKEIINARFLLAKVYETIGKTQNAIDEYLRIIEADDDMAIYYKLADLYCTMNDRYSAINILERGVKAFPNVDELSEYLSILYLKEGEYDKSLQYARNNYQRVKANLMKGNNEEALKLLESSKDETNANYFALYAEYYYNTKNFNKCSEYIDKFAQLSPQNPLVYQMRALVCDENNDPYGYHYNMGRCYSYKEDYELALAEYLNAHRVNSSKIEAVKEIIKINEASGDKTSLMEFYEKLNRLEPDNIIALKGLGDVYADMYEFSTAVQYYEKVIKLNNSDYDIFKKLGFCYEKLHKTALAKENYEKYLNKAPLSPDSEKLKEKISKMVINSDNSKEAENEEEGFIDKIMRLFGK